MDENKEIPQWAIALELDINKNTHEFEGKEYPLLYDDDRKERFINVNHLNRNYCLIECENQIYSRLNMEDCGKYQYDFENCIFTCRANFNWFEKNANFQSSTFEKLSSFNGLFTMDANFTNTTFKENAIFGIEYGLLSSSFKNKADFFCATFKSKAYFIGVNFGGEVRFEEAIFDGDIYFRKAIFKDKTSFKNADIKSKFLISGINNKDEKYESFNLDLTGISPSYIDYDNINVSKVTDRKTWLVLKQAAIKQNDHISALEFHKKEMLQYTDDLKKSANKNIKDKKENFISKIFKFISTPFCYIYFFIKSLFSKLLRFKGDRLILWFEKHASDFGTNAFKSILWIFILIIVFGIIIFMILSLAKADVKWDYFFNFCLHSLLPTNFASNIFIENLPAAKEYFENHYTIMFLIDFINLIKNILVGVLIYETIKSFRRFSRKL